ncbi:MAG: 4Fe-4S dicluster domain-containing protein [Desulfitobacterium hafniense]|nr:4Fe-4S dicluster domain-containing protein [Desulfitobacterium hafniense]
MTELAKQYAMIVQVAKCIGCQACTVACKFQNEVPDGQYRTKTPAIGPKGTYPNLSLFFEKEACQMCKNAPCVKVCPTRASYKNEDGVVLVDVDKCVGCKYCMTACPYDARFTNAKTGAVDKCSFCYEIRVGNGQKPACVSTCVGGALEFGNINDSNSDAAKLLAKYKAQVRKPEFGTIPNVYYIYEGVK